MGNSRRRSRETLQTVVKPLGIVTTPNPNGQYPPGAMSAADGAVMRRPGVLSSAPVTLNGGTTGNVGDSLRYLMPLDAGHIYSFAQDGSDAWTVREQQFGNTPNAVALPASLTTSALFTSARVQAVRSRDRMLCNSKRGVLVSDYMAPTTAPQRALRYAGLPQPQCFVASTTPGATATIPGDVMVAYRAILVREYSDGYILKSVPSMPFKVLNPAAAGSNLTINIQVFWTIYGSVALGDYVEIYRTDGLATSSVNADPGDTFKRVYKYQLNATDITNFQTPVIPDTQVLQSPFYQTGGQELYTNPYQEGSNNANRQPDPCAAMAAYKGFTFYGNITERPQFVFSVPGGINDTSINVSGSSRRKYGVGGRSGAGTITSGSNTITGISANDMLGIAVGQTWGGGVQFAGATSITAVGASTITMSANAGSNGTTFAFLDVIELNGGVTAFGGPFIFTNYSSGFETTANQTIGFNSGADALGIELVMEPALPAGSTPFATQSTITVRATNGQNYSPPLPLLSQTVKTITGATRSNLLRWSKDSEPEHVPSKNETFVGAGSIIAMVGTKDALWIACTDGIYRLSGDAGVWRLDIVAPDCVLCGPRCMDSMRDQVFAYTNYGFVLVTDSGVIPISDTIAKAEFPGLPFAERTDVIVCANDTTSELMISLSSTANQAYVFNTTQKAFSLDTALQKPTAWAYMKSAAPGQGSGLPALIFAGNQFSSPTVYLWDATDTFSGMVCAFRSFDAQAPSTNKQWVDMTFMFDIGGVGSVVTAFLDGASIGSSALVSRLNNEAVVTFGVPRKNAINPKLVVGFSTNGVVSALHFFGVSLRYVPLTIQPGLRQ